MLKKSLKVILSILAVILLIVIAFVLWLSVNEFKPDDQMDVEITNELSTVGLTPVEGSTISVMSWNIGYAGLSKGSDFFMDGGSEVAAADAETVNSNLLGIYRTLYTSEEHQADIYMLQEVDVDSARTYGVNESEYLSMFFTAHALNYSCPYVPYPLPPIGRVNSGIQTSTMFQVDSAERISLPCPFSWPVSAANLKRCMLVERIPVASSDKELVVINLHLEAYDDGEGKAAQTKQLVDFMQAEYEKGNYVIAGGDFNQVFPGGLEAYPNEHPELWEPGVIEDDMLPEGWTLAYDLDTPSCRLLNQPYDPADTENTQHYVIDGFIISPNVELVSVETQDEGFVYSDHNPVMLEVTLTADKAA